MSVLMSFVSILANEMAKNPINLDPNYKEKMAEAE